MYLQMLDRSMREDVSHAQTELGLCGGRKLIAAARCGIPNGGCAKAIEEGDPVRGAGRLHKGRSIQLQRTISQSQPSEPCSIPVTLELDDGCSMASPVRTHGMVFESQDPSRYRQVFLVDAQVLGLALRFVHCSRNSHTETWSASAYIAVLRRMWQAVRESEAARLI
jgi:hypothetical protein